MKIGTVALLIRQTLSNATLVASVSDDREIAVLEEAVHQGHQDPLLMIEELRSQQTREDDEFGDYVEELLSYPFVRPEIQKHGIQWLKSRIRIEQYRKSEAEATKIIADYAFKVFQDHPERVEFILAGPAAKVRIKILTLKESQAA